MSESVFKVGDKVLRKREKGFIKIGKIISITATNARVAWEDKTRIGGNGSYRTSLKLSELEPVTEEALRKRAIKWTQGRITYYKKYQDADKVAHYEAKLAGLLQGETT